MCSWASLERDPLPSGSYAGTAQSQSLTREIRPDAVVLSFLHRLCRAHRSYIS